MNALLELLALIPKSVQVVIASMFLGGAAFAGLEIRYMTVSDYTKGYVLDLKTEIRQLKKDIARNNLPPEMVEILQDQLEELLDELCYEVPSDPYCRDVGK